MGSFSIWHWLLVAVVIILLFGAKKVPSAMGDLAKGIKAFKRGLNDDSDAPAAAAPAPAPTPVTQAQTAAPTQPAAQPSAADPKVS
ncbi:twin-arginine translocase TatA/TatE family subunit [Elstera cyanobacteriorum]|uniref:twin-arginine translocase TatA/TatE family subunit n=1 Tax=Elstera cyanobacteriorum TaxID=2022747 RepID=UPI003081184C|nr:twin-arginine translocase TatA/TatE family subunit [Elstera cyanobacteriorum]